MSLRQVSRTLQFYSLRTSLQTLTRVLPPLAVRWAMRRFATPSGPRRIRFDFSKYPAFQEISLCFQQGHLRGYVWGCSEERPTVLLLHGWSGWSLQLGAFVQPLLNAGFAVIAFDLPAHGHSSGQQATLPLSSQALATIIRHFPHLHGAVGHSFGGATLAHAVAHGVRIPRIALLGAPAEMRAELFRFARIMALPHRMAHAMVHGWERKLGISFDSLCAEASHLPEATQALLVYDSADTQVPLTEMQRYQTQWPAAQYLITHHLGHMNLMRDPDTIEQVVNFLSNLPTTQEH